MPNVFVVGSGVRINCLLDTGAQVSIIAESFYNENLPQENDLVNVGQFISISVANGLDIPYDGYVELDVSALGHMYSKLGFVIVKDPQGKKCQLVNKPFQASLDQISSVM